MTDDHAVARVEWTALCAHWRPTTFWKPRAVLASLWALAVSKDSRLLGGHDTKEGPQWFWKSRSVLVSLLSFKRIFSFFTKQQGHEDTRTPDEFENATSPPSYWAVPIRRCPRRLSLRPARGAARSRWPGQGPFPTPRVASAAHSGKARGRRGPGAPRTNSPRPPSSDIGTGTRQAIHVGLAMAMQLQKHNRL